ncbi:MAG: LptF/LptG family permease [Thermodesulfovibrionales bacterium]
MKRLERYFLGQFIRYFMVFTIGLTFFFSAIDYLDHVGGLLPYDPRFFDLVIYYLLILPKYFLYLIPMSTLICSLLTFALASKRKEAIAYKASGGDVRKLLIPFLITGVIISLIDFGFNEYITPISTQKLKDLEYSLQEDKERLRLKQGNIWIRVRNGLIVHAETYIPSEKSLRKVVIFSLKKNRPEYMISARKAEWDGKDWTMKEARKYDFSDRLVVDLSMARIGGLSDPEVISQEISAPEEMGIVELLEYRKKLEDAGYKSIKLDVDIFSRMTYPLACLFMMLIGFSIALMSNLRSGILGVVIGIGISLVYSFLHSFMVSLGYAGVVMPAVAAGMAPTVFSILSVALVKRIPR